MSFFENMFLFPVKLLMKTLWILMPLILMVFILALLFLYPYVMLSYIVGFLVAPIILRKAGFYHVEVSNSLSLFVLRNQEMKQLETMYQNQLKKSHEKHCKNEQRLQNKILRLQKETTQLEKTCSELMSKKPDRVIYIQPQTFFELMKNKLSFRGTG